MVTPSSSASRPKSTSILSESSRTTQTIPSEIPSPGQNNLENRATLITRVVGGTIGCVWFLLLLLGGGVLFHRRLTRTPQGGLKHRRLHGSWLSFHPRPSQFMSLPTTKITQPGTQIEYIKLVQIYQKNRQLMNTPVTYEKSYMLFLRLELRYEHIRSLETA